MRVFFSVLHMTLTGPTCARPKLGHQSPECVRSPQAARSWPPSLLALWSIATCPIAWTSLPIGHVNSLSDRPICLRCIVSIPLPSGKTTQMWKPLSLSATSRSNPVPIHTHKRQFIGIQEIKGNLKFSLEHRVCRDTSILILFSSSFNVPGVERGGNTHSTRLALYWKHLKKDGYSPL
jgi:hypothetical protein